MKRAQDPVFSVQACTPSDLAARKLPFGRFLPTA